jgi:Sec-independent protein secretion pathway component TatC
MAEPKQNEGRMSLGDHLEDLRWRLILGLVGPLIFTIILLFFGTELVEFLVKPLRVRLQLEGQPDQVVNLTVTSAFGVYLKVCLIGGLICGLPWFAGQMWKFISPGLLPNEKKVVNRMWIPSMILTATGVTFMYMVMLPITLWFLIGFSARFSSDLDLKPNLLEGQLTTQKAETEPEAAGADATVPRIVIPSRAEAPKNPMEGEAWIDRTTAKLNVVWKGHIRTIHMSSGQMMTPMITVDAYISFVLWLALAFAVSFQLPLIMAVLGWLGLVKREMLAGVRRHALLGCFVVGMIMTPADVFSQAALAIPLYVLFELGLIAMWMSERKVDPVAEGADADEADTEGAAEATDVAQATETPESTQETKVSEPTDADDTSDTTDEAGNSEDDDR